MNQSVRFTVLVAALLCVSAGAAADGAGNGKPQKVSIEGLKYNPSKLTIKKGQTVVWTNKDDHDHTVVSAKKGAFESENLGRGDTFEFTFDKAGKFDYLCKYHPRMKGTITVEE